MKYCITAILNNFSIFFNGPDRNQNGYYAFVNFYSRLSAAKAMEKLRGRLGFGSHHLKVDYFSTMKLKLTNLNFFYISPTDFCSAKFSFSYLLSWTGIGTTTIHFFDKQQIGSLYPSSYAGLLVLRSWTSTAIWNGLSVDLCLLPRALEAYCMFPF